MEAEATHGGGLRRRDAIIALLSTVTVWCLYGFPGFALVALELGERFGWFEPADIAHPATFDPDGMEEGEGAEDAPEEAVPGIPEAFLEAPPDPVEDVAGDPTPPEDAPAELPPPAEPAQTEVVQVDDPKGPEPLEAVEEPAEPDEVAPLPTEPGAAPSPAPTRPGSTNGTAKTPSDKPASPPQGEPGVDPTKVKDVGDKASAVNKDSGCAEPHPQIKQVDSTHWRVEKDLVEYYTSSIPIFNTLGYSRKYDENGQKGWLIGGFGCKGPLYKAGLRSKDVIQEVNGKKTNTVAQIIGLWLFSKKKGVFEVKLLRKGKPMTFYYDVIP
jgi:hypothetical protein